ncbi:uncharacterized protein DS421_3g92260 [Arachis hypogaea]|nr:uncharacterized protein DS421_3g92260 [Arachis hypogaea]
MHQIDCYVTNSSSTSLLQQLSLSYFLHDEIMRMYVFRMLLFSVFKWLRFWLHNFRTT